jgi:hypothetical protein
MEEEEEKKASWGGSNLVRGGPCRRPGPGRTPRQLGRPWTETEGGLQIELNK